MSEPPVSQRDEALKRKIADTWGQPYDAMAEEKLIVLSANNEHILWEFEQAFSLHYALAHGRRVVFDARDVGGGGSKILSFLTSIYQRSPTAEIDVLWGGGDDIFRKLASQRLLEPLTLTADARANIPATFGRQRMLDANNYWAGSAVSGFGFIYNKPLLKRLHLLPAPTSWDDLADPRFFGKIALADPMQSGSATAGYKMIAQSAPTWPAGWAKLLNVLSNAKRFYDGASDAANAVVAEAPLATCIDFYGTLRVNKYPKRLVYVSPPGQTAFSADPIGILKNPPNPKLASAFVDFVLSPAGQALWALRVGTPNGPSRNGLFRTPIRGDVYTTYREQLLPGMTNPLRPENEMVVAEALRGLDFNTFRRLVYSATVANAAGLRKARAALIAEGLPAAKVQQFHALPPNIRTMAQMKSVAKQFRNEKQAERIMSDWRQFFADKYEALTGP